MKWTNVYKDITYQYIQSKTKKLQTHVTLQGYFLSDIYGRNYTNSEQTLSKT